jgi:hypothetical protein
MNRITRNLLWFSLVLTGFQSAFGQEVDVRILDAQNGRSVSNAVVWVQFYDAPANRVLRRMQFRTGADGVAHIELPAPRPIQLSVSVAVGSSWGGGFVNAATEDILSRGATGQGGCSRNRSSHPLNPKPGEVIILVCRIPWWQRLLAPLEKG